MKETLPKTRPWHNIFLTFFYRKNLLFAQTAKKTETSEIFFHTSNYYENL